MSGLIWNEEFRTNNNKKIRLPVMFVLNDIKYYETTLRERKRCVRVQKKKK